MSDRVSGWGPAALWAAVLFLLSAWEAPGGPSFFLADKIGHLGLYAVLGAALWFARHRSHPDTGWFRFLLLGWVYGITDEWHQSYVPGREPSGADWLADALGVAIGFGVAAATYRGFFGNEGPRWDSKAEEEA